MSFACKEEFLEQIPTGSTNNATLATAEGVEGLLVGAYAGLMEMGSYDNQWGAICDGPENWAFGGVCSDEATKGMSPTNESAINSLENSTETPQNYYCEIKWKHLYDAVTRTNDVLNVLAACDPPLDR